MYNLKSQICVVAGASSGIGRQIALELSKCGATVICAARRTEMLKETIEQINSSGGVAEVYTCDFKVPSEVEKLASYVKEKYKRIDLWMNGIGVNTAMGITWDLDFDEWFSDLDGNLRTCYIGTKCAINVMKDQKDGRIINMSGGGVVKPEAYNSAYACSKTAIVRFTECVALELQKENLPLKIFAFGPGLIRTERTVELVEKPETLKFMPGIIDAIRNDTCTSIEKPAEFVTFIASGAVDKLQGCLLATYMDKDELIEDTDKIVENGAYKIIVKNK